MGSRGICLPPGPRTKAASRSQATTRKPIPTKTVTVVLCNIRAKTLIPGTDQNGLPTTGIAPAPIPPRAMRMVPMDPSHTAICSRSR